MAEAFTTWKYLKVVGIYCLDRISRCFANVPQPRKINCKIYAISTLTIPFTHSVNAAFTAGWRLIKQSYKDG